MNNKLFIILIIAILSTNSNANNDYNFSKNKIINLNDITSSAEKNYPEILKFYEKIKTYEGEVQESLGIFDIKLKSEYQDKTRGFYDGKLSNYSIEKQNEFLGSKIYAGYRKSFGNFADYDGSNITNNNGEYRIGGSISLLRNSLIDNNRLNLSQNKLQLQENKIQLEKIKLDIKRDATKTYYQWLIAGHIFKTYQELHKLALDRHEQLKIRNQKGDIANIILIENERNILNRSSSMVEAKNNFDNQAISLSLYYRKENQEPIIINEWQLPDINFLPENFINKNISQDVEKALSIRPEIQIIKIKQQQEQNNLSQAQNLYKPNLNLNFEASKDLGNGSKSRSQTNNEVKLNFEVPLQQNIAKGKILQSNSKINLLKIEESFYRDKITNEIKQISNSIQTSAKIFNNYLQEYKLSQQLEKAERERFRSGNSDFFLINLREQEMASAKINKLVSFFKYQSLKADYQVAIFNNE